MTQSTLPVYFHPDVLSMKSPDGLFEKAPSPLLEHQVPFAEGPERIANIRSVMQRGPSADAFEWRDGRHATDEEIIRYHTAPYLEQLKAWDETGHWPGDTTYLPPGGLKGVRAAAGTVLAALEDILQGKARRAYALVRPPSHHAAPDVADGYCFLNAVGMAARTALAQGYSRIAVVDWDVHHGNGTQAGFYDAPDVLTISLHMNHGAWGESHPQTGEVDETGRGAGQGFNLNLPLPMGTGNQAYQSVLETIVIPALERYKPDLIISSNGQDASQFDPNGRQCLDADGFHAMARTLSKAADRICDGRLLIVQEGGYNVAYTGFCAYGAALGFIDRPLDLEDPLAFYPEDAGIAARTLRELVARHPLLDDAGRWSRD